MKRDFSTRRFHCNLTSRTVNVREETVSAYGESPFPVAINEGRKLCLNMDSSCPRDCVYLGGVRNPEVA